MSYEEYRREPYTSVCACGKGYLRRYRVMESNDWGQEQEYNTEIEILCDYCKEHYHYEHNGMGEGFLVPNGLSIPEPIPPLNYKDNYSADEEFIGQHEKTVIEAMIADMTAPKHRFIKDLIYPSAIDYANRWAHRHKKKSLDPMIDDLRRILAQYDELAEKRKKKTPRIEAYKKQTEERYQEALRVELHSFRPLFLYDAQQDKLDHERARKEQAEYITAHRYDPFQAWITYHESCKVDSTGHYWDSLRIVECVDPQYLILDKPQYGSANITIVKKYLCKCTICGKEILADSSGFEILYEESKGFYPVLQCDCHKVSSFEAKVMDILNGLGISYAREVSFDGLTGDSGFPLRFDFALFDPNKTAIAGDINSYRLLIELQGPHHYKLGYYDEYGEFIEESSPATREKLTRQENYDDRKRAFCAEKGIPFEPIKYTASYSYEQLEQRISAILFKYGFEDRNEVLPFEISGEERP